MFMIQMLTKFHTPNSSSLSVRFFRAFFLSCKANARVKAAKMGHGPHSSKIFMFFYVLFFFVCVVLCTACV